MSETTIDLDTSYVRYTDGSIVSLSCHEGRHEACPQAPDDDTGEPADRVPHFGGYYCECCEHDGTRQECANCGERVGYVSTRGWCDGCEEIRYMSGGDGSEADSQDRER